MGALVGLGSLEVGDNYGGVYEDNSGPYIFTKASYEYLNTDTFTLYTRTVDYPKLQLEWFELDHKIGSLPNVNYEFAFTRERVTEVINYGLGQGFFGIPTACVVHSDTSADDWPSALDKNHFDRMYEDYVDTTGTPRLGGVIDPDEYYNCANEYALTEAAANSEFSYQP